MRGVFVTATDTGVGKTVLAAALCAALRARGVGVAARKPVLSGLDDAGPHDHELLAACTGQTPDEVCSRTFGPPVSPHLAAELAGVELDLEDLATLPGADTVVVEGVGGLLVPLNATATVRDLAVRLGFPLVVAARPGLGTINHTLLTIEAARAAGLDVRAVVLTPWPVAPGPDPHAPHPPPSPQSDRGGSDPQRSRQAGIPGETGLITQMGGARGTDPGVTASNRRTIAGRGGVDVHVLPRTELDPASLAAAAAHLPVEAWLGPGSVTSQGQVEPRG